LAGAVVVFAMTSILWFGIYKAVGAMPVMPVWQAPSAQTPQWDITIHAYDKGLVTFNSVDKPYPVSYTDNPAACWQARDVVWCGVVLITPHVEVKAEGPKEGK
jgi:hypothetical protein